MKKAIALILLLTLSLSLFGCSGSGKAPLPTEKVISSCGKEITAAEFLYFYSAMFTAEFRDTLKSYGVDETSDWETKPCPFGDETWLQYFCAQTVEYVTDTLLLCSEGERLGVKPAASDLALIDKTVRQDKAAAAEKNMTADEYYAATYGEGFNTESLKKLIGYICVADGLKLQKKAEARKTTDYEKYYSEHKSDCDLFSFTCLPFTYLSYGEKAEAEAKAFFNNSEGVSPEVLATLPGAEKRENAEFRELLYPEEARLWLSDGKRLSGDKKLFSDGKDFFILIFEGRQRSERPYLSLYFLKTDNETAEDLLSTYEKTEKTEAAFLEIFGKKEGFKTYENAFTSDFDLGGDFTLKVFDGAEEGKTVTGETEGETYIVYIKEVGKAFWREAAEKLKEREVFEAYLSDLRKSAEPFVEAEEKLLSLIGR